jgi:hypothetical protein
MKLSTSALAVLLSASAITPSCADIEHIHIGGRLNPGYNTGYVDTPVAFTDDTTGLVYGDAVDFSLPAIFPWPETITIDTPNFGDITAQFAPIVYYFGTPDGTFWEMTGSIDGTPGALFSVNLVYGVPNFGIMGNFNYDPPPPPCTDCNPPPPCLTCGPPPIVSVPETSTWLMMLFGFIGLSVPAFSRRLAAKRICEA